MKKETNKKTNPLLEDDNLDVKVEDNAGATDKKVAPAKSSKGEEKVDVVKSMKSDIELTKEKLAKQEQVSFLIPLGQGESKGAFHEVFINGAKFSIPKGRMTLIPKAVADLLANSYSVEMDAGSEFRLDLNAEKADKLA